MSKYAFDRYVNGELKAEGIGIIRASSLGEAINKAVWLLDNNERPATILVYNPANSTAGEPKGFPCEDFYKSATNAVLCSDGGKVNNLGISIIISEYEKYVGALRGKAVGE